jgi:archaellum component FlaC
MEHNQNDICKMGFDAFDKRLCKIESKIENYSVMEERIKNIAETVATIAKKLEMILDKPRQRWDLVIAVIITAIASGLINHFIK